MRALLSHMCTMCMPHALWGRKVTDVVNHHAGAASSAKATNLFCGLALQPLESLSN